MVSKGAGFEHEAGWGWGGKSLGSLLVGTNACKAGATGKRAALSCRAQLLSCRQAVQRVSHLRGTASSKRRAAAHISVRVSNCGSEDGPTRGNRGVAATHSSARRRRGRQVPREGVGRCPPHADHRAAQASRLRLGAAPQRVPERCHLARGDLALKLSARAKPARFTLAVLGGGDICDRVPALGVGHAVASCGGDPGPPQRRRAGRRKATLLPCTTSKS